MLHFGFSYIGCIYLVMLLLPNFFWTKRKPEKYDLYVQNENKVLLAFERVGEVLVCVCALLFAPPPFQWTWWQLWLGGSFALMLLYELYWVRYFNSARTMRDFYSSFAGVPVAGATLPVCAFALLSVYEKNLPLLVSTAILGVGHIGIHLAHRREAYEKAQ